MTQYKYVRQVESAGDVCYVQPRFCGGGHGTLGKGLLRKNNYGEHLGLEEWRTFLSLSLSLDLKMSLSAFICVCDYVSACVCHLACMYLRTYILEGEYIGMRWCILLSVYVSVWIYYFTILHQMFFLSIYHWMDD